MGLPNFAYDIKSGPVETTDMLAVAPTTGNCRLAVQLYFHYVHGLWFRVDQILCPALFRSTGRSVSTNLSECLEGDVLLAERIRNRAGEPIDRSRAFYPTEEEWIVALHSAILLDPGSGRGDARIWHATAIAGGTCEWSQGEFEKYYRVVAVKRLLPHLI